jgi:flagellar FliJ protein
VFKFRLQRVLDLRTKREQEVATQLSEARTQVEAAQRACDEMEEVQRQGRARLAAAHGADPTVGQLQNLSYLVAQLSQHVEEARSAVQSAEANAEKVKSEFTAALQERRVLDRLREKHLETWKADEVQADRSAMDEIALARFTRTGADLAPQQES